MPTIYKPKEFPKVMYRALEAGGYEEKVCVSEADYDALMLEKNWVESPAELGIETAPGQEPDPDIAENAPPPPVLDNTLPPEGETQAIDPWDKPSPTPKGKKAATKEEQQALEEEAEAERRYKAKGGK